MAIEVELPDGSIAEFPDGTRPEVIQATLRKQFGFAAGAGNSSGPVPAAPSPDAPAGGGGGGVGRSLGLTGRGVAQGLGSLVGTAAALRELQPSRMLGNVLGGLLNGKKVDPIERVTTAAGMNPGTFAANALDAPKPETEGERLATSVIEGAASVLPTLALGGAPAVARAAPAFAGALRAMPFAQLASGAAAGGAAQTVAEGGGGPVAQMAAALGAGALPLLAAPALRGVTNLAKDTAGVVDLLTPPGQRRQAGQILQQMATDPEAAAARLAAGDGVLLEGSAPTMAQASGDRGLALLEKSLANTNVEGKGGELGARYLEQQAARQEAANSLLDRVREEIPGEIKAMAPGYARNEAELGETLRKAFDENYAKSKEWVGKLYSAIDPDGTASFDLRPLRESFGKIIDSPLAGFPSEIKRVVKDVDTLIANGQNAKFVDVQDLRRRLATLAHDKATGTNPDGNTARIAGLLRDAVDDYMVKAASPELQGAAPVAQPGSRAYREATQLARGAVSENAWLDDLQSIIERGGLNQEAVEKLVGKAGVEELRRLNPGVVRKSGPLMPDTVARELPSFQGMKGGGVDDMYPDDFLQELMARLGGNMGGKRRAMNTLRENALEGITPGHTGLTPEQAEIFRNAKLARTEQGRNFEQGANAKLAERGNKLGGAAIDESKIPANYFQTPEGVKAFFASMGENPAARQAALDWLAGQMLSKAKAGTDILPGTAVQDWLRGNAAALDEFAKMRGFPASLDALEQDFPGFVAAMRRAGNQQAALDQIAARDVAGNWKLRSRTGAYPDAAALELSAEDRALLDAIRADEQRAYNTHRMANVAGSHTAQLQNIEAQVKEMLRRFPGASSNRVGQALLGLLDGLTNRATRKVYGNLTSAALDPAYALQLLRGAMPTSRWARYASRPTQTTWQTLKDSRAPHILNMTRALMAPQGGNTNRRAQ